MLYDPQLTANFSRLALSPEFAPFREWLNTEREFTRDKLETLRDSAAISLAQGDAQRIKIIQSRMQQATEPKPK